MLKKALGVILVFGLVSCGEAPEKGFLTSDQMVKVTTELDRIITHEMDTKGISAFSISITGKDRVIISKGFGFIDEAKTKPVTTGTLFRVGSISKLITDIAMMQQMELGAVELDAPITTYLPDFKPENPYGAPITLRHLVSHQSGIVREPPVGHYFDYTTPTLTDTVLSMNLTKNVAAPGAAFKYSNAGIATIGRVLEVITGKTFIEMATGVIAPLGMNNTSFERLEDTETSLPTAYMYSYDGDRFKAPLYDLGIAPAGNMYSTMDDLSILMRAVINDGEGDNGRMLSPKAMSEMLHPETTRDAARRVGLGFILSDIGGHKGAGHGGAIYGYASQMIAMYEDGFGVAASGNIDQSNAIINRIVDHTIRVMYAIKEGKDMPKYYMGEELTQSVRKSLEGTYQDETGTIVLRNWKNKLFIEGLPRVLEVKSFEDRYVVDGIYGFMDGLDIKGDIIKIADRTFKKATLSLPPQPEARLTKLIGEYGWDHDYVRVFEWDGKPYIRMEWADHQPMEWIGDNTLAFPKNSGLYKNETISFTRDEGGNGITANLNGIIFERRNPNALNEKIIKLLTNPDGLRDNALAASPPEEEGGFKDADLVALVDQDPGIKLDIRYAGTNNFAGFPVYDLAEAYMQRPAAIALGKAHRSLAQYGYGLMIHDAYRPWYVTKMFWDATPEEGKIFVADPSRGSRHNRGSAVDLTLYDLATGEPLEMTGGYDEMSIRSYPGYIGGTDRQRWLRDLLRAAMEANDFDVYEAEWWHFDYSDWQSYGLQNKTFDQLK